MVRAQNVQKKKTRAHAHILGLKPIPAPVFITKTLILKSQPIINTISNSSRKETDPLDLFLDKEQRHQSHTHRLSCYNFPRAETPTAKELWNPSSTLYSVSRLEQEEGRLWISMLWFSVRVRVFSSTKATESTTRTGSTVLKVVKIAYLIEDFWNTDFGRVFF